MRQWIELLMERIKSLDEIARGCETVDQFIRSSDGCLEPVLYRGHHDDVTPDNAFMTDYVGHAAEYADPSGKIDAFVYDPDDVLYYDDERFEELRSTYRDLSPSSFSEVYRTSLAGNRFADNFVDGLAKIRKIVRSNVPYSKICGNPEINDTLVPLLQKYALDKYSKNIIAFHGSDYSDYGGQTEFVVGDISKLTPLQTIFAQAHSTTTP